jgi:antirestriction protein ArdC
VKSVYDIVTDKIIEALDNGVAPWNKPWAGGETPQNLKSKKAYRGINAFVTGMSGYACPYWATFKQIGEAGGRVKKGERGTPIVFFKKLEDEKTEKDFLMARFYKIWNVEQCEGIEWEKPKASDIPANERAERLIEGMPMRPEVKFGGGSAFYRPDRDEIQLPERGAFKSSEAFYSTYFHELAHSTGHEKRLKRESLEKIQGFGTHERGISLCGVGNRKSD